MDDTSAIVKGSAGEHLAMAMLLLNGYNVYRHGCDRGSIDIMAERDGQVLRIQVKVFFDKTFGSSGKKPLRAAYVGGRSQNRGHIDAFALVDLESLDVYLVDESHVGIASINKKKAAKVGTNLSPLAR